jgi:Tol biopolymer transport system component
MIASGGGHVVLNECDETLTCQAFVVDPVSGDRRAVTIPEFDPLRFYGPDGMSSLSPDGTRGAFVIQRDDQLTMVVSELATGKSLLSTLVVWPTGGGTPKVRWSGDGRWLVWQSATGLWVWDSQGGEPRNLSIGADINTFELLGHG